MTERFSPPSFEGKPDIPLAERKRAGVLFKKSIDDLFAKHAEESAQLDLRSTIDNQQITFYVSRSKSNIANQYNIEMEIAPLDNDNDWEEDHEYTFHAQSGEVRRSSIQNDDMLPEDLEQMQIMYQAVDTDEVRDLLAAANRATRAPITFAALNQVFVDETQPVDASKAAPRFIQFIDATMREQRDNVNTSTYGHKQLQWESETDDGKYKISMEGNNADDPASSLAGISIKKDGAGDITIFVNHGLLSSFKLSPNTPLALTFVPPDKVPLIERFVQEHQPPNEPKV